MNEQRIALRQRRDLGEIIQAALHLYQQNFAPLFIIAAVVIPLGIASAALQRTVDDSVGVGLAVLGIAILQLAVNLLAGAAIIIALTKVDQGGEPTFADTYDAAFERFWTLPERDALFVHRRSSLRKLSSGFIAVERPPVSQ